ncbi:hypothetical protein MBLNU459_g0537t1 [Dothideomycetes sp. NU459]
MRVSAAASSSLLLLLLPALVSAKALEKRDALAAAATPLDDHPAVATPNAVVPPTVKPGVGTKDAPVDGLDGKPHAGPFVDISADEKTKKPIAGGEDIKKPLPTSLKKLKESAEDWELIPEKNDGVMDATDRKAPKKGTTGTEGGVSERTKKEKGPDGLIGEKTEKDPIAPKEAPPLPHSEEEQIKIKPAAAKGGVTTLTGKPKGAQGLEKPTDLPDKPHDALHPKPVSDSKDGAAHAPPPDVGNGDRPSSLKPTLPYTEGHKTPLSSDDEPEGLIQPFHSFVLSLTMILVSEIGDKTFLVAALMAMRHPRLIVYSAALSALVAMTVLSAVLGHAVPTLLPKRFTAFAAGVLFLVFGAKMLREGLAMPKDSGVGEEMKEVEAELEEQEHLARKQGRRRSSAVPPYMLEAGRGRQAGSRTSNHLPKPPQSPPSDSSRSPSPSGRGMKASVSNAVGGLNNLLSLLLSPAWVQTFIMTFLGEWGDRSQIATIAMAAGQDYWWVTGGAISGHAVCTGVAVLGGRALAGRVSLRVVTLGGAIAFLVFAVIYLLEAIWAHRGNSGKDETATDASSTTNASGKQAEPGGGPPRYLTPGPRPLRRRLPDPSLTGGPQKKQRNRYVYSDDISAEELRTLVIRKCNMMAEKLDVVSEKLHAITRLSGSGGQVKWFEAQGLENTAEDAAKHVEELEDLVEELWKNTPRS